MGLLQQMGWGKCPAQGVVGNCNEGGEICNGDNCKDIEICGIGGMTLWFEWHGRDEEGGGGRGG